MSVPDSVFELISSALTPAATILGKIAVDILF